MFRKDLLGGHRLVPVAAIPNADQALGLAEALVEGGLPVLEITLRTDAALDAIRAASKVGPSLKLGAGTVVTKEQAAEAVDAGAQFIVSPGLNASVVEYCLKEGVPVLPGVCTPTEVEMARAFGLKTLKFFPAESFGGAKTLKAMSAVYADFRFVPTGGITVSNVMEYLALPTVLACGGSWMVPQDTVAQRDFRKITELVREAVRTVAAK